MSSDERRPFVLRDRLAIAPLLERADKVILIETKDGVQRMALCEMFEWFDRYLAGAQGVRRMKRSRNRFSANRTRSMST